RLAETVEALGTGELGEDVGQVGGDGSVADRELRARAAGEGQEEGEERGPVAGHSLPLRRPARRAAARACRLFRPGGVRLPGALGRRGAPLEEFSRASAEGERAVARGATAGLRRLLGGALDPGLRGRLAPRRRARDEHHEENDRPAATHLPARY